MTTEEPTISTPWRSDPAAQTERIEAWANGPAVPALIGAAGGRERHWKSPLPEIHRDVGKFRIHVLHAGDAY